MTDTTGAVDTSNNDESVDTQSTEETEETSQENTSTEDSNESEESEIEETPEELKARLAKAEELASNYKIRAEKAEKVAKLKPPATANDLNSKDLVAITNARIPEEDIDEVLNYAKYRKMSIPDILKDPIMKSTLSLRAEERETASAANTAASRRSTAKVSDDVLLSNANRGKFPESDTDIERLMKAKYKAR